MKVCFVRWLKILWGGFKKRNLFFEALALEAVSVVALLV